MISIRSIFLGRLLGCWRHCLHELFSFLLPSVERFVELHGMLRRQLLCNDRTYSGDGDVCSGQILGVYCERVHQLQQRLLSSVERPVELHGMPRRQLLCDDRAYCGDGDLCSRQILGVDSERLHQLQRWLLSRQRRAVILLDLFIGSCISVLVPTQHHFDGFRGSRLQAWVLLLCPV